MKTTFKLAKLLVLFLLLTTFACSSDDDSGGGNDGINVQNLITTFDENPTNGQVVGTVQAVGDGTLSFSITSQTPAGALSINPTTGELTVVNATLFDFETNPVIAANVSILSATDDATATATINLNNLDDIESFLSTSKADYIAATDGDWVIITEAEYNALASSLNQVTKVACSDDEYDFADIVIQTSQEFTIANDNGHDVPNASYVFAFKFHAITDSTINNKVLISDTSVSGPYTQLGDALPTSTTGDQFYVIKGNNLSTSATGFLGFYNADRMGYKNIPTAGNYAFENSDALNLTEYYTDVTVLYQGLSSTQKQW